MGSAYPGATFVKRGREDTWVLPVLAKQQARHITQQEQPPGLNPGMQEGTTQLTHGVLGEITYFTTCFVHWLFPHFLDNSRTWSHQSKQGAGYTGLNILKISDFLPDSKQTQGLKLLKSSQKLFKKPLQFFQKMALAAGPGSGSVPVSQHLL